MNEWFDPPVLDRLSMAAARISLAEGEAKQVEVVSR
jgi:hypothetical protein